MDVDETVDLVDEMNTVTLPASAKNPYNNAFANQSSLIKNESDGQRSLDPSSNRLYVFRRKWTFC